MKNSLLSQRWFLAILGLVGIAFYLFTSIQIGPSTPVRKRPPVGTVEDIAALADRDDVNILFVLIDTLRSHRMSVYGHDRDTTPFLAELAKTSVRFDHNIAQSSWTKSSMASIWSGLNPTKVGVTKFDHTLSQKALLPAEILSEEGFMTVGLYRNGWVHGYFGFDQGFDKYFRPMGNQESRAVQTNSPNVFGHGTDENMIEEAIEFLRIHGKSSRWFLYLHMMDLHEYVYDDESALFGNGTADLYDNSMRRTDWLLSRLYDYLGSVDLLEETIIVFLSDHGEAFGERGFEGHARAVLPESTETPLIVSLPFALDSGAVVESSTTNVDVWPTLLDLLGLPMQENIDGVSRVPEILAAAGGGSGRFESSDDESRPIISYLDQNWGQNVVDVEPAISVSQGDYRFVSGLNVEGVPFEALLSREDEQKLNQIEEHPEVAERLREIAKVHIEMESAFGVEAVEMDEMQINQLRALGYELP